MKIITITIPLPDRKLQPNNPPGSKQGRIVMAEVAREYRCLTKIRTLKAGGALRRWHHAECKATFYFATKRRRDFRNFEYALKPAYDGLVDAGLILDDNSKVLSHKKTVFAYDKKNPRVVLEIERIDAADIPMEPGEQGELFV
ncbi:MAG: hypothetical protein ACF8OB_09340 [Phycisphaeraceae bacterium JB051]